MMIDLNHTPKSIKSEEKMEHIDVRPRTCYRRFLEVMRQRVWALMFLAALVCFSTMTFAYVEGKDFFDSFYWTMRVISTVGSGAITPKTQIGKLVSILDSVSGITILVYLITSWHVSIIEARLERKLLKEGVHRNWCTLDEAKE